MATFDDLPEDLQRYIQDARLRHRIALRRRMAQRRLAHTRRRAVHDELTGLYEFLHGQLFILLSPHP